MSKKNDYELGDFVETIHGVNGVIIGEKQSDKYGKWIVIITASDKKFFCSINDIKGRSKLKFEEVFDMPPIDNIPAHKFSEEFENKMTELIYGVGENGKD